MEDKKLIAEKEITDTLRWCNFCTRKIGISFIDELPSTFFGKMKTTGLYMFSGAMLSGLILGEITYVTSLLISSTSVAEFVASLHIVGYGCMSMNKMLTIWSKRHVFRQLIADLVHIWPVTIDEQETAIKQKSLSALRLGQFWYMFFNISGVIFYNATPIVLHVFRVARGTPSHIGYIWHVAYPFDKTKPFYHVFAFVFEAFTGVVSVWAMLSSDLLFTTLASNISMLLRILQVKIRNITTDNSGDSHQASRLIQRGDGYEDIVLLIKIHQKLISYSRDLEDAFSMVNLINVLLSSMNICFVVFNIVLLEPWMEMSNKLFLSAALTQVGILCWYADDLYRTSTGIADAVYESGWYKSHIRCRRALLLLLQRSQKPLCFTALKFRNITMSTYSSILTNSYSYFTLLYTIYRN